MNYVAVLIALIGLLAIGCASNKKVNDAANPCSAENPCAPPAPDEGTPYNPCANPDGGDQQGESKAK